MAASNEAEPDQLDVARAEGGAYAREAPEDANAHLEIAVADAADGRFVPGRLPLRRRVKYGSTRQQDYERLLAFRTGLRRFLSWSGQQAEAAGLVARQTDASDARTVRLVLTGHGAERLETLAPTT